MGPLCKRPPRDPNPSMLIGEISKLFRDKMRQNSEKLGFKNGYRQMLMFLSFQDGVTQIDLVRASHFKAPTVSVTLKKMEEEGLVRREADAVDMRQTRVYLTDKGRELNELFRGKIIEFEKMMLADLSKEETETLLCYLTRVRDKILSQETDDAEEDAE